MLLPMLGLGQSSTSSRTITERVEWNTHSSFNYSNRRVPMMGADIPSDIEVGDVVYANWIVIFGQPNRGEVESLQDFGSYWILRHRRSGNGFRSWNNSRNSFVFRNATYAIENNTLTITNRNVNYDGVYNIDDALETSLLNE